MLSGRGDVNVFDLANMIAFTSSFSVETIKHYHW